MTARERLSPNQSLTLKFPVVGEREPQPFTLDQWRLSVGGLVRKSLSLTFSQLAALPAVERTWDTICVTGWTHLDHRWRGVLLSELLDRAGVQPAARFVRFAAHHKLRAFRD